MMLIRKAWKAAVHFFDVPEDFEPAGVPRWSEIKEDYGWLPIFVGVLAALALGVCAL